MPSTAPVVSRRRLLAGGAAFAVLGAVASGCGSPPPAPPRIDDLKAQLELARRDSELATAAAAPAPPMAAALTEIASERSRHAQALTTEIARVIGNSTTTSTEAISPTTSSAPAAPAPSVSDVVNALRASAESAEQLATTSSGYRAGLLGSISASCTAAYVVALGTGEPAP